MRKEERGKRGELKETDVWLQHLMSQAHVWLSIRVGDRAETFCPSWLLLAAGAPPGHQRVHEAPGAGGAPSELTNPHHKNYGVVEEKDWLAVRDCCCEPSSLRPLSWANELEPKQSIHA